MFGPPTNPAPGTEDDDAAAAALDHARREVVAQLHRDNAVALHHRLGRSDRVGQERLEVGVGARAVDQEPDVQVRGGVGDRRRGVRIREIDCQRAGLDAGAR